MKGTDILRLVVSIIVCFAAASVGGLAMDGTMAWYRQLEKPALTPPSWLFGPVWTILYLLMGIALFLIWSRADQPGARMAIGMFIAQLVLNALWTPAFFGMQSTLLGLAVIIPLDVLIVASVVLLWRIHPPAGWLLLPYLAWTAFATYLNASLHLLNR